jgi:hypothetical protein
MEETDNIPVDETGKPNRTGYFVGDNVVKLETLTKLDLNPEVVLDAAKDQLSEVVVLGWEKELTDGGFYFAASDADMSRALVLLEVARADIVRRLYVVK